MKKFIFTIAAALLLVFGCAQKETPTVTPDKKEKADPELSVGGVPTAAVESGTSFTLTLSTKSEGSIRLTVDKPAMAGVRAKSATEYEVSVFAVEDTKVAVSVSQEAAGDYLAAAKDYDFQIKGIGKSAISCGDDPIRD